MEEFASGMPGPSGGDSTDRVSQFETALEQRVGSDRYRVWFTLTSRTVWEPADGDRAPVLRVVVGSPFAAERIRSRYLREIRAAAATVDPAAHVRVDAIPATARQVDLPLVEGDGDETSRPASTVHPQEAGTPRSQGCNSRRNTNTRRNTHAHRNTNARGGLQTIASAAKDSIRQRGRPSQTPSLFDVPGGDSTPNHAETKHRAEAESHAETKHRAEAKSHAKANRHAEAPHQAAAQPGTTRPSIETFLTGDSNALAVTAAKMVLDQPFSSPPVYFSGPSGVGKTHLLQSIGDQLRRRHRLRNVMLMTGEDFTNQFVDMVQKRAMTNFRARCREVDALLVDDVHCLAGKTATIREFLYTIGEVAAAGKPLVFTASCSPHELDGIGTELAGRLTAGLVCPLGPLDPQVRRKLLIQNLKRRRPLPIDEAVIDELQPSLSPDGRTLSGLANGIELLQRMHGRSPTVDEIRSQFGHLLGGGVARINLRSIEQAVCDTFGLESDSLRRGGQTRRVTQPRMLAMYLSRQKTSSAFSEIAKHYGVRSHSTAMAAQRNVEKWISSGQMIGRGAAAISIRDAIEQVERILQTG
ncbi:MAG: DnaA/Hda family protein [Planctomycetota bacterium]